MNENTSFGQFRSSKPEDHPMELKTEAEERNKFHKKGEGKDDIQNEQNMKLK